MDLISLMKQLSLKNNEEPVNVANLKAGAENISGVHTDIAFCEFSNQLFVVATQYGKAGTCMKVVRERLETDGTVNFVYSVNPIFGDPTNEQETTATFIAKILDVTKPLLIFVNLKQHTKETVCEVASAVRKLAFPNQQ